MKNKAFWLTSVTTIRHFLQSPRTELKHQPSPLFYVHCDLFRDISGIKPSTAERSFRLLRQVYLDSVEDIGLFGYKAKGNVRHGYWLVEKEFETWLKKMVKKWENEIK